MKRKEPASLAPQEALKKDRPLSKERVIGTGLWVRMRSLFNLRVNGASLALFRIAVGLIMALEAWSLCRPSASSNGEIPLKVFYTGPNVKFHFAYPGFHWLPVLPNHWIEITVGILAVSGLMLSAGLLYRLAAVMVFLS